MNFILRFILILSLVFSQLTPYSVFFLNLKSKLSTNNTVVATEFTPNIVSVNSVSKGKGIEANDDATIVKDFITVDLEGYATLDVPQSHFKISSSSSSIYKILTYRDNKSKINMSYVKNITANTDIPGYIAKEVADVSTTTNDKKVEVHGDNIEWMVITANNEEDGCKVYVYYTLSENKDTAFWMKVKVAPESEDDTFKEALNKMLDTYGMYYINGTMFDTPTTGYYSDNKISSETNGDTTGYEANSDENTVYKDRGGFVKDADISNNWKDLEIIIDGSKFKLPCNINDFYDKGFKINSELANLDTELHPGLGAELTLINDIGTVVTVYSINESEADRKAIKDCSIVKIKVDKTKFLTLNANGEVTQENNQEASQNTQNSEQPTEQPTESAIVLDHGLILPGGVTWDVYSDDLLKCYGKNCSQQNYTRDTYKYKWTVGTKYMEIQIGTLKGIVSVEISCIYSY